VQALEQLLLVVQATHSLELMLEVEQGLEIQTFASVEVQ
jgi:hypothetical protein